MQAVGVLVGLLAQHPDDPLQRGELLVSLIEQLGGLDCAGGVLGEELEDVDCSGDQGPALVRYTLSVPTTVLSAISGSETIAR